MNASISDPVGMPPRAPTSVTDSEAAATATGTAMVRSSPSAKRTANTPLKVSPAPVVSRTCDSRSGYVLSDEIGAHYQHTVATTGHDDGLVTSGDESRRGLEGGHAARVAQ